MGMKVILKNSEEMKRTIIIKGYSIRSFSVAIGISSGYLSQILKGDRNPSGKVARTISDELGIEFEEYFFVESACKS